MGIHQRLHPRPHSHSAWAKDSTCLASMSATTVQMAMASLADFPLSDHAVSRLEQVRVSTTRRKRDGGKRWREVGARSSPLSHVALAEPRYFLPTYPYSDSKKLLSHTRSLALCSFSLIEVYKRNIFYFPYFWISVTAAVPNSG